MTEKVNHPNHYMHHYMQGRIEVAVAMDVLGDASQWLGHALKYACRASHKGNEIEDLRKAIWCAEHACDLGGKWPTSLTRGQRQAVADALCKGINFNAPGILGKVRIETAKLIQGIVLESGASTYELLAALDQLELDQLEKSTPIEASR